MTGKFLTHIPNRAEGGGQRKRGEGAKKRSLTAKYGRAQHANDSLPPKQTCEKFGRWSDERTKEEGMKGRERACQMKGTP